MSPRRSTRLRLVSATIGVVGLIGGAGFGRAASLDVSTEFLKAKDARVSETSLGLVFQPTAGKCTLDVTSGQVAIDYAPAAGDLVSAARSRTEERTQLTGTARWEPDSHWTVFGGAGGYGGFTDLRSVWLDEYYRQLFQGVPGYRSAHPAGWHGLVGARWEYLPSSGYLQVTYVRQQDRVSPGYEPRLFAPLLRGRERLATDALKVSTENVLAPNVRTLLEVGVNQTTGRDPRYSLQGSCAWSVSEDFVIRAVLAGVAEQPNFTAESAALTLEHDWDSVWFAGVTLRAYHDSGEVVDPLLETTAAPTLQSWHLAATLRWQSERAELRLEAGPYWTRYGALPPISAQFSRLYSDRDWIRAQFAWTWRW